MISFPSASPALLLFLWCLQRAMWLHRGKVNRVISQGGKRGKEGPGSLRKEEEESKCFWEQTTLELPPALFQVRFLVQQLAGNRTQLSLHLCLQHPSQNLARYRCEINIWWMNAAHSCSLFRWVVCKHFSLSCLPLLCKVLRERLGTCWGLFRIQTVLLWPVRTGRPPPHQDCGFLFSLEKEAQLA